MIFTLLCGFFAGIGMIIYRGLYFGPLNQAINTMGMCLAASVVFFIFLQILASIGGFFLRIVFVIIFASLVFFGGTKLWNIFNPDNPIVVPTSISQKIDNLTGK